MSTARQVIALLKSYVEGEEQQFYSAALQMAAHEARQGHGKVAQEIRDLIEQAKTLQAYNLFPRRKILLVGPPGSGKTMTASALAGELQLPLLTAMYSSLIGKFMGETASRPKLIFDAIIIAATNHPSLLDEAVFRRFGTGSAGWGACNV